MAVRRRAPADSVDTMTSFTPIELVTDRFLDRLVEPDVEGALESIDDDILYTNVGLPAVRGKRRFATAMRLLNTSMTSFDYRMLNVAVDLDAVGESRVPAAVVLTERIDELRIGRLRLQFWVCGRFEVRDARIVVWRDYFDFYDCTKALIRGLAALVFPSLLPPLHAVTRRVQR